MTPQVWQRLLRAVATLVALDGFAQAMFAGRFMAGSYDGLDAHSLNAPILAAGILFMTLCFTAAWRFGQASGWSALLCVALTGCTVAEMVVGSLHILAVHIPLGVALVAGMLTVTVQLWLRPTIDTEVAAR